MSKINNIKNVILKYKLFIICLIIIILSIVSIYIQKNDRKDILKINGNSISNQDGKIGVYITGEIKTPGVYYLKEGSRLDSLIDIAGGFTENADISKINLSKKLIDSDKISVPKKTGSNTNDESSEESSKKVSDETQNNNQKDKININTATKEELMELSGVGQSTAQKIIDYRNDKKFEKIEDIMNVKGIGQSKYDSIKDSICVD